MTRLGISYDWTIHDYYTICPRAHLARADGRYCGEPDTSTCDACIRRLGGYHGQPVGVGIAAWRDQYGHWLAGARRIFVPDPDVESRLRRYFPESTFTVRPHIAGPDGARPVAATWTEGQPVRVAVIGAIQAFKGAEVVHQCALDASRRRLPLHFVLVGYSDRDRLLKSTGHITVTGAYQETDVYELLEQARCHIAWLPSLLPETYMYTLSIAQSARLYPVAFDIGAQARRIREAGWGRLLPLATPPRAVNDELLNLPSRIARIPAPPPPRSREYPSVLRDYYDLPARLNSGRTSPVDVAA